MKSMLLALLVSFSFAAQVGNAEPSDENTPGSREETYEGNEREGGSFDGGGYDDGEDGGMIGELFNASFNLHVPTIKTVTEDRGSMLVVTITRARDAYPGDNCSLITVQIVDKKSGNVKKSDSINSCDNQIL